MRALKIVPGAVTMGKEGVERIRLYDPKECAAVLDVLQKHGHDEIDTQERGLSIGTKLQPRKIGPVLYSHKKEDLKRGLQKTLQALRTEKVDLFYLHAPNRSTLYEETLEAVNELYNAGSLKRFGLCNYPAWEVAQICELCSRHGWKKPNVYQGVYYAIQRTVEPELFSCLRHYGIAFYEVSPIAGGMLTDRYERDKREHEPGSRFDPNQMQSAYFRKSYWNEAHFDAIRPTARRLGMTTAEAVLRWSSHHSMLKRQCGDAVITVASSMAQLEENLENLDKGPLPEEMVKAFDQGWAIVKGVCGPYAR